jgi:hypothetical protein
MDKEVGKDVKGRRSPADLSVQRNRRGSVGAESSGMLTLANPQT